MKLKEVMTRGAEVIRPEAALQEAAEKMKSLDVGSLPVCDGERLVGMITDRDITIRATSGGKDPRATPVREVMTADTKWCFEDDDAQVAAEVMAKAQIRRLPIVDREKRLVGIVSLGDLATMQDTADEASEALEEISETAQPTRS
ncbi:MAG: CBS domain-containing protein [Actinomycetota bacterium]